MRRFVILLTGILVTLAVMFGCEDRGTNIKKLDLGDLDGWSGVDPSNQHPFVPALSLQLRNPTEQLLGATYLPPEAVNTSPPQPLPLLVLLAPETGNRFYYFQAGLSQLARELTASGDIQPMIIYCIANDQSFGGYFYADSDPGGHYDSIFKYVPGDGKDDLLEYLHRFYPSTIQLPSKRGLGGVGQGAYGAFRIAIMNPGVYTSISVTDGPLDFDHPTGGLTNLFDQALAEQEAYYFANKAVDTLEVGSTDPWDVFFVDTTVAGVDTTYDTTWVNYDTTPFSYHRHIDSSYTMPVSMMLIGGSFAFSPNDTLIDYDRRISGGTIVIENVDRYSIADSTQPNGGDSTTFVGTIVKGDFVSHGVDMDFHLPFDSNGNVYTPIWSRWMRNNLDSLYVAQGGSPLDGVSMWFGTNDGARWGYYQMTQSWIEFLRDEGYEIEEHRYGSYSDDPIVHDEYIFDVLREMLIFHSNNFGD
ncbi:MAG: hypothetical protein AB1772_10545 [Candidatus Zixiibacteriota bacterium]